MIVRGRYVHSSAIASATARVSSTDGGLPTGRGSATANKGRVEGSFTRARPDEAGLEKLDFTSRQVRERVSFKSDFDTRFAPHPAASLCPRQTSNSAGSS